jgi:hypothetical protein
MTDEARRERMNELLSQRRYSVAIAGATERLARLGLAVARDDVVPKEAVQSALAAAKAQDAFHLVWHRVWGARLRSEVIETTGRLAGLLDGERAVLVWGTSPPVGALVSVSAALLSLPAHIGPDHDAVGPGGVGSDLLLVADGGQSGLRLEYNHHSHADEYELRAWGRYARSVVD